MRQPVDKVRSARPTWFLRLILYFVLAASAVVTLLGLPAIQRRVDAGALAPLWLLAPALGFGLFLLVYAVDRFRLVRFRGYPSGRALFQVFFGLVFLMLLLPSSIVEYRSALGSRPPRDELATLIRHRDARVRAMACELAGLRQDRTLYVPALGRALADRNAKVALAARLSLRRITGRDFAAGQQGLRDLEAYLREHANDLDAVAPTGAGLPSSAPGTTAVDTPIAPGERGRDAASAG